MLCPLEGAGVIFMNTVDDSGGKRDLSCQARTNIQGHRMSFQHWVLSSLCSIWKIPCLLELSHLGMLSTACISYSSILKRKVHRQIHTQNPYSLQS